jgi:hypothetical protein
MRHSGLKICHYLLNTIIAVVVHDKNFPCNSLGLFLSLELAKNFGQPGSAIVGRDGYSDLFISAQSGGRTTFMGRPKLQENIWSINFSWKGYRRQ